MKRSTGAHRAVPTSRRRRFRILEIGTAVVVASALFINVAPTEETEAGWKAQATATTASLIALQESPPQIATKTLPAFVVGTPYYQQLQATAGSPVTWSVDTSDEAVGALPDGITLSDDGVLSGTPTALYPSNISQTVTFIASSDGGDASVDISLSVYSVPTASGTLSLSATASKTYSYKFTASAYPTPTWTRVSGTLPTGLSLASNGTLSGTPTVTGTSTFTLRATNSAGSKDVAVTFTVSSLPTITTTSLRDGLLGEDYYDTVDATGDNVTYSISAGALPGGVKINPANGVLYGVTTATGTFNFTVKATNSAGSATQALSIVILVPSITLASPQYLYQGISKTVTVTTSNFAGTPTITSSGTLPSGMTFTSPSLSGTPTSTSSNTRTLTFTAKAGTATATKAVSFISTPTTTQAFTGSYPLGGVTDVSMAKGKPGSILFKPPSMPSGTSWGRSGTAPAGTTFISNAAGTNLRVYGVPTTAGTYTVTFTGRTTSGTATSFRVRITVA